MPQIPQLRTSSLKFTFLVAKIVTVFSALHFAISLSLGVVAVVTAGFVLFGT